MALPLSVNIPVTELQLPLMPFWFVNASVSSAVAKPVVMLTVALARLVLSISPSVRPESTAVAVPFSV